MKKVIIFVSVFLAFFCLVLCFAGRPSRAQIFNNKIAVSNYLDYLKVYRHEEADPADGYRRPTVKNLSQLYWALGMLNTGDDEAIEEYLLINECDMFRKFPHDGAEWEGVKRSTRASICRQKSEFPARFEIVVPISLGTPDPAAKKIALDPAIANLQKMDVAPNTDTEVCGSADDMQKYPRNFILNFDRPFSLPAIPASQELLDNIAEGSGKIVYLRLKVSIEKYSQTVKYQGQWRAVLTGDIDGYEVYTDPAETKILYGEDFPGHAAAKRVAANRAAQARDEAAGAPPAGDSLTDLYQADAAPAENDSSPAPPEADADGCGSRGDLPF